MGKRDATGVQKAEKKKAAWLTEQPQEANPDGASAELRRRTAKQAERGEGELQFDLSNP